MIPVPEAAKRLGIPRSTLYALIQREVIPAVDDPFRQGGKLLNESSMKALEAYLDARRKKRQQETR